MYVRSKMVHWYKNTGETEATTKKRFQIGRDHYDGYLDLVLNSNFNMQLILSN